MLNLYRGTMLISAVFSVCQIERDEICGEYYIFSYTRDFLGAQNKEQKINWGKTFLITRIFFLNMLLIAVASN